MRVLRFFVFSLLCAWVVEAYAIRVSVTREAQDLYRIDHRIGPAWVVTRYCYEWAYYSQAILDLAEDEIYFISSGTRCEVVKVVQ